MRIVLGIAAVFAALVVGGAAIVSWWLLRPETLETYVLDAIEERTGVRVEVAHLHLGLSGLVLESFEVFEPAPTEAEGVAPLVLSAEEVVVRPQWRALLDGRIVISYAALEGLDLSIRTDADGSSNLGRLIDAFTTPGAEAAPAADARSASTDPTEETTLALESIAVRTSRVAFFDQHERPTNPLRLGVAIDELRVWDLVKPGPASFELSAGVSVGRSTRSDVRARGTLTPSPLVIDADVELSEVDVDSLVPDIANPDDPTVPGPLPLEGVRVQGRVTAKRVVYEGFVFTDAKATAKLEETTLVAGPVTADIADGTIRATADVDFGVQGFRYTGTAAARGVNLAKAGGLLEPISWGRKPSPSFDADVQLSMAGTTADRLLDSIDLRARVSLDAIDVGAALGLDASSDSSDLGPFDTGDGRIEITAEIAHALWGPYEIEAVRAETTLAKSHVDVSNVAATIAEGNARLTAHVDLTRPGLAYDGALRLRDARIGSIFARLSRERWGTRSGILGLDLTLRGEGTDRRTVLRTLHADGVVTWTNGRVTNSEYLRDVSDLTGIPGFRDLVVENSGGAFQVRDGVLSTERMRVWGPDAGIQVAGTLDHRLDIDAQVALGIGPHSDRELFSTGIALPYVQGDDGWRFVPVNVRGNLEDPKMTIPPRAVLKSALTTVPSAGAGVVSTGLGAVRGGTHAVLEGTRSILPGSDGAIRGTESAIDSSTGFVGGVVRDGAGAVGSFLGGLFDAEDEDPRTPTTEPEP